MHCPKCDVEMTIMREDISFLAGGDKQYKRIIYKCVEDDIWLTVEVPK